MPLVNSSSYYYILEKYFHFNYSRACIKINETKSVKKKYGRYRYKQLKFLLIQPLGVDTLFPAFLTPSYFSRKILQAAHGRKVASEK